MKSYAICPVSEKYVNERVARINALLTVLILIAFGLTNSIYLITFLAVDFFLRATDYTKFSPIVALSQYIVKLLSLDIQSINAGPKIFAARIGLLLTVIASTTFLLEFFNVAYLTAGILGFFCFLEAAFGICVACKLYPFIYKYLYRN